MEFLQAGSPVKHDSGGQGISVFIVGLCCIMHEGSAIQRRYRKTLWGKIPHRRAWASTLLTAVSPVPASQAVQPGRVPSSLAQHSTYDSGTSAGSPFWLFSSCHCALFRQQQWGLAPTQP